MRQLDNQEPESRLFLLCEGIIEAVWISAICVAPLLLNPERVNVSGEGPKLAFVQMLAVLGLAAWAAQIAERKAPLGSLRPSLIAFLRAPLAWPLCLLGLAIAASTWFSISRETSLWGAVETCQGALTWFAGLSLLAMVASHLRKPRQFTRLTTVLIITSFGVSLLAIVQRAGFDPRHMDLMGGRVISTLGHPTYLAGYLVMVCPVTIWRLVSVLESPAQCPPATRAAGVVLYLMVLAAQIGAIFCAESRGSFLGLGAGLFLFGALCAIHRRSRKLRWVLIILLGLAAAAFCVSGGSLGKLASLPGFRRFALSTPLQEGGDPYRTGLWNQTPGMIFSADALPHPTGGTDAWHRLRPWFGYGPETVDCVLPHFQISYSDLIENRLHNLLWDEFFSLGCFGLLALLLLLTGAFFHSFRALGLLPTPLARRIFVGTLILSGLGGALVFSLVLARGFAPLGLAVGFVLALLLFALCSRAVSPGPIKGGGSGWWLLLAALVSALAGSLIDLSFVFWTSATATLFWVYLGILIALCLGAASTQGPFPADAAAQPGGNSGLTRTQSDLPGPGGGVLAFSLIAGLAVVTILFSVLHGYFQRPFTVEKVLGSSLMSLEGLKSMMVVPLAGLWIGLSFALALDTFLEGKSGGISGLFTLILLVSGGLGLGYALFKCGQIVAIGPLPDRASSAWEALERARGYEQLYLSATVILLLLTIALGWALTPSSGSVSKRPIPSFSTAIVAFLVASICMWQIGIRPSRADLRGQWGIVLQTFLGLPNPAIEVYRNALAYRPGDFLYSVQLGKLLSSQAMEARNSPDSKSLFAEAAAVLEATRKPTDLNRGSFHQGELYLAWALKETGPERGELARKAALAFSQARVFEPRNEMVWTSEGIVDSLLLGDEAEAERKRGYARELAGRHLDYWADYYAHKALASPSPQLQMAYAAVAQRYYDGMLQTTNITPQGASHTRLEKAKLLLAFNNLSEAIVCLEEAAKSPDVRDLWQIEAGLAEGYLRQANLPAAAEHLERSLLHAPEAEKPMLLRLQAQIRRNM